MRGASVGTLRELQHGSILGNLGAGEARRGCSFGWPASHWSWNQIICGYFPESLVGLVGENRKWECFESCPKESLNGKGNSEQLEAVNLHQTPRAESGALVTNQSWETSTQVMRTIAGKVPVGKLWWAHESITLIKIQRESSARPSQV